MAKSSRRIVRVKGSKDLERFRLENDIGVRAAASALGVSHPAYIAWETGASKPDGTHRKIIATWTKGKVPEESWLTPKQLQALGKARPFDAKGAA